MDQKVILRFRNASKAGSTSTFAVNPALSISIGRDPSCEVYYDQDSDDLVSRQHSKITVDPGNPASFVIADFGSRNGTFVNHQRISGVVKLTPGDVVQLGPGGPEFEFDLDPRPAVSRPTRLATPELPPLPKAPLPTREAVPLPPSEKVAVGKATIERMIVDSNQKATSKAMLRVAAGIIGLVVMTGGLLSFPSVRAKLGFGSGFGGMSPSQVSKMANESVVFFEVGWKLVDMESGRPLYQLQYENKVAVEPPPAQAAPPQGAPPQGSPQGQEPQGGQPQGTPPQGAQQSARMLAQAAEQGPAPAAAPDGGGGQPQQQFREIVPGGPSRLPVFVSVDGSLEPLLVTEGGDGKNQPIGGRHSGTGFVVSSDGFILTNRHVASAWLAMYEFDSPVGLVMQTDQQGNQKLIPISARQFPRWVPSRARFIVRGRLDPNSPIVGQAYSGKNIEGRNDYLEVTFPRNRERVQAKLVRISDQADVALAKIDMPHPLQKLELSDTYNTIAQGDSIAVLGYPGVSPAILGSVQSKEALTPSTETKVIPDPTLSVGNIGRIIRGKAGLTEAVMSTFGDVYQLTVNSTGRGNSGGPVMDETGKVIGLFTYSAQADALITFAVPIRYGIELMGTKPVM